MAIRYCRVTVLDKIEEMKRLTFCPTLLAKRISLTLVVTAWVSISWVKAAISYKLWDGGPPRAADGPPRTGPIFWDKSFLWSKSGSNMGGGLSKRDSCPKRRELGSIGVSGNDLGKSGNFGNCPGLGGWPSKIKWFWSFDQKGKLKFVLRHHYSIATLI